MTEKVREDFIGTEWRTSRAISRGRREADFLEKVGSTKTERSTNSKRRRRERSNFRIEYLPSLILLD